MTILQKTGKISKFIVLIVLLLSLFSCLKQKSIRELEDQKILNFIFQTALDFDTTRSEAIYHISYKGVGNNFIDDQRVTIIYSGFYQNNSNSSVYFIENDTAIITIGDRNIMKGWSEVLSLISEGGSGIIIFPYYIAYQDAQTPNIEENTSIYFYFRVLNENYWITQNTFFWNYIDKYANWNLTIFEDSLCYIKYFDGLGDVVNQNQTRVDYLLANIYDTIKDISDDFLIDINDENITQGLKEAVFLMREGEMGKIIVPPSLGYTDNNIFDIEPYSALVYEVRAKSDDPNIEENSKINKYIFVNNLDPDTIFTNGIYKFQNHDPDDGNIATYLNANIFYSDSVYLINNESNVFSCQNCTKSLNASNFNNGVLFCLLNMKKGEHATFIIPYSEAYGINGSGEIPPYATLVYKVKIMDVF